MADKPRRPGLISDFLAFLKEEKLWWMIPLLLLLGLLALLLVGGQVAGPLAPFLYPFA